MIVVSDMNVKVRDKSVGWSDGQVANTWMKWEWWVSGNVSAELLFYLAHNFFQYVII